MALTVRMAWTVQVALTVQLALVWPDLALAGVAPNANANANASANTNTNTNTNAKAKARGSEAQRSALPQVVVDAAQRVHPFADAMRGANIGNWTFYWGRLYPNDSAKLRELTKLIKPGVIRYAGGLASNKVMWDRKSEQCYPYRSTDGCQRGPLNPAKDGYDRCTGGSPQLVTGAYSHVYQPDEIDSIVKFANYVGAELMIEVNIMTCDPAMWGDMVRYANVEKGYGIKYWELGNEFDLLRVTGRKENFPIGKEYVRRYKLYYKALKAVDPSIQIVGPTTASHTRNPIFRPFRDYIDPLLNDSEIRRGKMLDVLSYHYYPLWNGRRHVTFAEMQSLEHNPPPGDKQSEARSRRHAVECAAPMREALKNAGLDDVPVAITEFNAIAADRPTALLFNHANVLYLADMLGRLAYGKADMILNWELYDAPSAKAGGTSYGLISHNNSTYTYWPPSDQKSLTDKFAPMPVYYTYFMYANLFGDYLVYSSSGAEESLSVWASVDSRDAGALKLMVINMADKPQQVALRIDNFSANTKSTHAKFAGAKSATAKPLRGVYYELSNAAFTAAKDKTSVLDGSSINGLEIDATSAETIQRSAQAILASGRPFKESQIKESQMQGHHLIHTFAPHSVTSIVLRR